MTSDMQAQGLARAILVAATTEKIVIGIPGGDYRLHLIPTAPIDVEALLGKRIRGTIEAKALRIFTAPGGGGGQFIEPIEGAPRIVAGRVLALDRDARKVLISAAVPLWLTLDPQQSIDMFAEGALVNCYVESGATFTPADQPPAEPGTNGTAGSR